MSENRLASADSLKGVAKEEKRTCSHPPGFFTFLLFGCFHRPTEEVKDLL